MSEWIEHDGSGLPVPVGTIVVVRYFSGQLSEPYPAGTIVDTENPAPWGWNCSWHWSHRGMRFVNHPQNIVAYRIVDDGAEAETARREARMKTFRNMVDGVSPPTSDPKLPAPKKRERV